MRSLMLLLVPAALFGGQPRYARVGDFEGQVEVQLQAGDAWAPAQRNLPLIEGAWLRATGSARAEIEFDDGSVFRVGPDSLAEISDMTRLSTGQRVTLLSLDRGLAYFTGQPEGKDAISLAIPGAQVNVRRGSRIRLEARDDWSQAAVLEGAVRFSSPAAEFDLGESQTARVEPAHTSRFFLYREVTELDLDRWNEQRDKLLAASTSGRHVPVGYGLADLDSSGEWVQTDDLGAVWKPKIPDGWAPYRLGRWQWYDTLGYTWIAGDSWGWLPYHYGRWTRKGSLGWIWAPGRNAVFKPGDVFWMRAAKMTAWGPLAPGEDWNPANQPRQFLKNDLTWAAFQNDARVIDPAGFTTIPAEPLAVAAFALALPSPAFLTSRLEAVRPPLRAGSTRIIPSVRGVAYDNATEVISAAPVPPPRVPAGEPGEPAVVVVSNPPPPPPQEVIYPVPVYTGVVIVNPPENGNDIGSGRRRRGGNGTQTPQTPAQAQTQPKPAAIPPAAPPINRTEQARERRDTTPKPAAAPPLPPPAISAPSPPPINRTEQAREHREHTPPAVAPPVVIRSEQREPRREHTPPAVPKAEEKPADKAASPAAPAPPISRKN